MDHEPHVIPIPVPRSLRPMAARRRTCLLVALRPERGLSHALTQHLAAEMPRLAFTLTPREGVEVVWLCGYEAGHRETVEALRRRHGDALLLVTGRSSAGRHGAWAREAADAGADVVLPWPVAYRRLEGVLSGTESPALPRAQGF